MRYRARFADILALLSFKMDQRTDGVLPTVQTAVHLLAKPAETTQTLVLGI
jgi:phage tail protein X